LRRASRKFDRLADHQFRDATSISLGGTRVRDDLAGLQHRDRVADPQDFVELVADEENRSAFVAQPPQQVEQIAHLLRREHGRRLVENEYVGAAIEQPQDFHNLS
jgi:hypothetical protein